MREEGLEPSRVLPHRNLNPARLPIPPLARESQSVASYHISRPARSSDPLIPSRLSCRHPCYSLKTATQSARTLTFLSGSYPYGMNLARGLERRLEMLADGASASVFRGKMHPIDIASRLVRQLEFLARDTPAGPEVPNHFVVRLNSADVDEALDQSSLELELSNVVMETAAERGWRLLGPVTVQIVTAKDVPRGILEVDGGTVPGPTDPWCQLFADDGSAVLDIGLNRSLVGRALDSDIRIANHEVSRHHMVIYRENGVTLIRDLGSANGTFVNGVRLSNDPVNVTAGDSLMLGNLAFTYKPVF